MTTGRASESRPGGVPNPSIPFESGQRSPVRRWLATWWRVVTASDSLETAQRGPMDERRARRFRFWTMLLAAAPMLFMAAVTLLVWAIQRRPDGRASVPWEELAILYVAAAAVLALGLLAGVSGLLLTARVPDDLRKRRAALACYLAAPLALMALAVVPLFLGTTGADDPIDVFSVHGRLQGKPDRPPQEIWAAPRAFVWMLPPLENAPQTMVAAGAVVVTALALWVLRVGLAVWRLTRSAARTAAVLLGLPIVAALLSVALWALPATVMMLMLAFRSVW